MRAIWHFAINNLAGRKGRSLLLVAAVALATSLTVAAAAVLGTMQHSLAQAVGRMTGLGDVTVRHRYGDRMAASFLDAVRSWPQVEVASGRFGTGATLSNPNVQGRSYAALVGVQIPQDAALNPLALTEGRPLRRPGETVIDQFLAQRLGLSLNDPIEVRAGGSADMLTGLADMMLGYKRSIWSRDPGIEGHMRLKVVGIVERPRLQVLQRPTALVLLEQARRLANVDGTLDSIHLKLREAVDPETFRADHQAALPPGVMFQTAAGLSAGSNRMLRAVHLVELIINLMVMLCCGLLVLTGLTTAVEQRQRELATLRCVGATRWQIAASQILCGLLLAGAAACIAVPLGLSLGYWMYLRHQDAMLAGFKPEVSGVCMAVAAALLAGLLGSIYPAFRAVRVPPVEALAMRAARPRWRGLALCGAVGILFALAQPIVFALPVDKSATLWFYIYAGIALTLIGYFLLSVPLLIGLSVTVGPVAAALFRVPCRLLRQSLVETPYRHGFTGAALMLGVAMLVAVWMGGRSILAEWFVSVKMPDGFVHSPFPMSDAQWVALRDSDAVSAVCPTSAFPVKLTNVRFGASDITPPHTLFTSFKPQALFQMADLDWVQGDPDTALKRLEAGGAVLVSREYLVAHGLGVGSKLTVDTHASGPVAFDVVGVISSPGLDVAVSFFGIHRYYADASVSTIFGTRADAARFFNNHAINLVLVNFQSGLSDEQALTRLRDQVPGTIVGSARQIRQYVQIISSGLLSMASAIAIALLFIACFGVSHIILANLAARRYEFGVLRAMGAPRWFTGRFMLAETLIIALAGAALGTALGIQFALIDREFLRRLYGWIYELRTPWDMIAWACLAAVGMALLATLPAAWRVARTSPRALLAVGRGG